MNGALFALDLVFTVGVLVSFYIIHRQGWEITALERRVQRLEQQLKEPEN